MNKVIDKEPHLFNPYFLVCRQPLEKPGQITTFWESTTGIDGKKNPRFDELAFSMRVVTNSDNALQEAKISDRRKQLTAKFDKCCNPVEGSYAPEHEQLAKDYGSRLRIFLSDVGITTEGPSATPQQLFKPHAMGNEGQKTKAVARSFEMTAKLQAVGNIYRTTIPTEVARAMNLRGGMQVEWTPYEKYFAVEPVEGHRYTARIWRNAESMVISVKTRLVDEMGLSEGMKMHWGGEKDNLILMKGADNPSNTTTLHKGRVYWVAAKAEVVERVQLIEGQQVEMVRHGEEIIVKPHDKPLYFSSVIESRTEFPRFYLDIPGEIAAGKGLAKGMEIGFRINEQEQLLVIPKQS
ncbi:AbrB/MazE/SpoVT family DNA-binding domain-containing protein [Candidatus Micrarchaeota archaeon]|nr:AbrB/MazE/SpoVT family DNA-binding domain-containing protein [Candidatus Micrarchaeota archaeon]